MLWIAPRLSACSSNMRPTDSLAPIQRAELQLAVAHQLRWHPASITMEFDEIIMTGWALTAWEDPEHLRFLINGEDFEDPQWPLPSPDLAGFFDALPSAGLARFRCHHPRAAVRWQACDGFTRLNVTSQFGEHALSYRTAWYLPDSENEAAMPEPHEIAEEVGGAGPDIYCAGGATLALRLDAYLRQRFSRSISSFDSVLEWGCGSGRVTRYLGQLQKRMTAVDLNVPRLAQCAARLPAVRFVPIDRLTALPFETDAFDLVVAPFIAHQLDEPSQHAWLRELRRLVRPGGIVLASVWGQALAQLHRDWGARHLAAYRCGLYAPGADAALDASLAHTGSYSGVRHSHDYVLATWGSYFQVVEIVPGMVHAFDLVVLRALDSGDG
ncbi:MAG: class I SAM-dependent methyltransferase [Haliea sp.]|nr:MAG: class I SAM-dependent methyltransferase [Haliea sp.]